MRPDEERAFQGPALIDVTDAEQLRLLAEHLDATPAEIADAVREVGPNLSAVELWLCSPMEGEVHERVGGMLRDAGDPRAR